WKTAAYTAHRRCVMAAKFIRLAPAFAVAFALSTGVLAHPGLAASKEVKTAAAHAGMAMGSADLKMAHAHLQHVVNCLVGPAGNGYDAQAEDPCKGMGQGAIADAKGDAATEANLQQALQDAESGLKATTLDDAHADARKALSALQAK
ncbi:MAG: hypothetical protein ACTHJ9_09365, partial [Rhodanobacter sp.]